MIAHPSKSSTRSRYLKKRKKKKKKTVNIFPELKRFPPFTSWYSCTLHIYCSRFPLSRPSIPHIDHQISHNRKMNCNCGIIITVSLPTVDNIVTHPEAEPDENTRSKTCNLPSSSPMCIWARCPLPIIFIVQLTSVIYIIALRHCS